MPFHFAAARSAAKSPVARILSRRPVARPANDNPGAIRRVPGAARGDLVAYQAFGLDQQDLLLEAALRHFAEHGIGAAREARKQAENAFFADDRQSYEWWLGICRALDRRLAQRIDAMAEPALTV